MHLFRFQRTWFYPAYLGRLCPGYQTMSTIKGTLKQSSRGRRKMGIQRDSSEVQQIYSQSFNSPARKRKKETKLESQGEGICPISLRSFKISLNIQRNICQNMHTLDIILSHKNPSHLTILEGNAQAKSLRLEFQIPQVLCKSTKSMRIGARILVAESFS